MTYLADYIAKISEPNLMRLTVILDEAREALELTRDRKSVEWVELEAQIAIAEAAQHEKRVRI